MKVTIGEAGLNETWQAPFPEIAICVHCGGISRIGFVAHEGCGETEYVSHLHENGGEGDFWLHDACCVAVYFCKDCLKPTALYNQA